MNPLPYKRRPATSQLLFPADGLEGVQHRLVELLHGRRLLQLPHLRLPQLEHAGGVAHLQSGSPYLLLTLHCDAPDHTCRYCLDAVVEEECVGEAGALFKRRD